MESHRTVHPEDDIPAKTIAYAIYILNLCSFLMPVLPIIAVIFAYIFENDPHSYLKSHYQYLIRSFWLALLYFGIAGLLVLVLIGIGLIPLVIIWWFIRMIKGLKSLLRKEPVARPTSWLF